MPSSSSSLTPMDPEQYSVTPKMAGVFEVEVDGVEHDHGLEHHNEPNQVRAPWPP